MDEPDGQGANVVVPVLKVTGVSAGAGLLVGSVTGTLRGTAHPGLWTAASGIQWGLMGGTYWSIRSALLLSRGTQEITPTTKAYISSASGALSAAFIGAITRGRANVIPGTIVGSLVGYFGQMGYDHLDRRRTEASVPRDPEKDQPLWNRALRSKWSPVKYLTDEEYKKVLEDKLLNVDTEIAVLDDDIAALRKTDRKKPDVPK